MVFIYLFFFSFFFTSVDSISCVSTIAAWNCVDESVDSAGQTTVNNFLLILVNQDIHVTLFVWVTLPMLFAIYLVLFNYDF